MSKFRGATAIIGIGQTPYYKRGTSPDPETPSPSARLPDALQHK